MRLLLALVLTATLGLGAPALAEDALDPTLPARPGSVALYLTAQRLAALGQSAKDPLMVLAAARILHGLRLSDTARLPDPPPANAAALTDLPGPDLLGIARRLDAGQNYSDLTDMLSREVPPHPKALRATASTLGPGQSEVWTLPFFGGTYGELAILGDGKSNLDMVAIGAGDTQICVDNGSADVAFCGFTLVENGMVMVTVSNTGTAPDSYLLLTE